MKVAFLLDCRRGVKGDGHFIAKILQYWCAALEDLAVFGSTRCPHISIATLIETDLKVWLSFKDTFSLETLRGVLPQLITTSISFDSSETAAEHESGIGFLTNFIDCFTASPKIPTKLVLFSSNLEDWVPHFAALQDCVSTNGLEARIFTSDLLSIDCIEVIPVSCADRRELSCPITKILKGLGISGTAKQVPLLQAEFLQIFRALVIIKEPVKLTVKGSTLVVGSLTRLSLRETPHQRPWPCLAFDVRSRASWSAIPQQAICGASMLVTDNAEGSEENATVSGLATALSEKAEVLILRASLDPQTFEGLPDELGIRHLFVAHPQSGDTSAEILIQGLLPREYFIYPLLKPLEPPEVQDTNGYKSAREALRSLGFLELYNPLLYSCRMDGTLAGISTQQANHFAEALHGNTQRRRRAIATKQAQAAPRIAHKPYVLETNRTGSADNSPERPTKRQTLGASLSTKQRCLSENLIQQPNKPHKLCSLFRSVFDNPSDAAQRGNERGNEQ